MNFHTDKDLKTFQGEKDYVLEKEVNAKKKFGDQSQKKSACKRSIFWVTLIQVDETLRLLYDIFIFKRNIWTLKKSASSLYYEPR